MAEIKDDVPTLIEIVRTGKGDIIRAQAAIYLHDNALKSENVRHHSNRVFPSTDHKTSFAALREENEMPESSLLLENSPSFLPPHTPLRERYYAHAGEG